MQPASREDQSPEGKRAEQARDQVDAPTSTELDLMQSQLDRLDRELRVMRRVAFIFGGLLALASIAFLLLSSRARFILD